MAQIPVAPFVMKDALFKVAADNYEKHVSSILGAPSTTTPTITWQGLTPSAKFSAAGVPETKWVLNVSYAQDWKTANSFSRYLLDHAGQEVEVMVQPQVGTGETTFTMTVTIVPGPFGGDVNSVAVGTVQLPISGEPVPGTAA